MTNYQTESRIAREISAGERLLWSGRPRQGVMLRPADALLIPFSLLWCGFAIFWEASVITTKAPFFFKLWGIPFVLVGLYLIVGRFFADARQRERTMYAVTTERIIIISGLLKETVKSLNLKTLSDISLSEKSDGTGTVSLGPSSSYAWFSSAGWPGGRQYVPPALEGIPNARSVYEAIRQAQKAAIPLPGPLTGPIFRDRRTFVMRNRRLSVLSLWAFSMLFVMFSGVTTVSAAPPAFKFKLSSGIFSLPANAQSVDWALLNDSSSSQDFRVTVYQIGLIGPKTAVAPGALTGSINPNEAFHNANSVPFPFVPAFYYEVVVEINDLNVLPTTHVWQDLGNTVIPGTRIGPTEFKLLR